MWWGHTLPMRRMRCHSMHTAHTHSPDRCMPYAARHRHADRWGTAESSAPLGWAGCGQSDAWLLHAGNCIGESGSTQIAEAIKVNQTIMHLNLGGEHSGRGHMLGVVGIHATHTGHAMLLDAVQHASCQTASACRSMGTAASSALLWLAVADRMRGCCMQTAASATAGQRRSPRRSRSTRPSCTSTWR